MGTLSNVIEPARESHDKVPERLTGTPRISYSTLASDKRLVFDRTGSNPVLVDFLTISFCPYDSNRALRARCGACDR